MASLPGLNSMLPLTKSSFRWSSSLGVENHAARFAALEANAAPAHSPQLGMARLRLHEVWGCSFSSRFQPGVCGFACHRNSSVSVALPLPQLPRSEPLAVQVIQLLLLLKRIHAPPEAVIRVGNELFFLNQPLEWFPDEVFTVLDVIEDCAIENKVSAIDHNLGLAQGFDFLNQSTIADRHAMTTQAGADAQKRRCLPQPVK